MPALAVAEAATTELQSAGAQLADAVKGNKKNTEHYLAQPKQRTYYSLVKSVFQPAVKFHVQGVAPISPTAAANTAAELNPFLELLLEGCLRGPT